MTYTVDMNKHQQAVWNALEHIDNNVRVSMDWNSQVVEWLEEFDIVLRRGGYPKPDTMTFRSEEDAIAWLLRFS